MRILSILVVSLLSLPSAHAQPQISEGFLRGLQTELVRQSAFTSARKDISNSYKHAATNLAAAIKAGKLNEGFEIYAKAVKFEGRVRLERGTRAPAKTFATQVRGFFGLETGSAEARQQSYDLQRLVTIFGRNGLYPNRNMEKNALVLYGAHKERMAGRLKPGTPRSASRVPPRSSSKTRLRTPSARGLARSVGLHR